MGSCKGCMRVHVCVNVFVGGVGGVRPRGGRVCVWVEGGGVCVGPPTPGWGWGVGWGACRRSRKEAEGAAQEGCREGRAASPGWRQLAPHYRGRNQEAPAAAKHERRRLKGPSPGLAPAMPVLGPGTPRSSWRAGSPHEKRALQDDGGHVGGGAEGGQTHPHEEHLPGKGGWGWPGAVGRDS